MEHRTPAWFLLPPPPMAGNFPITKDKAELRGRPRQCWDNGALCPGSQSWGRRAKGRLGPSCQHPGTPLLARTPPRPTAKPSTRGILARVLYGPPRREALGAPGSQANASPSMVSLCKVSPSGQRKEPSPVPASCRAGITPRKPLPPAHLRTTRSRPEPLQEARDPVLLVGRPSQAEVPGKARGTEEGALMAFRQGRPAGASYLLPGWSPCGGGALAGVWRRGPESPTQPLPPRLHGADPGPPSARAALSGPGAEPRPPHKAVFVPRGLRGGPVTSAFVTDPAEPSKAAAPPGGRRRRRGPQRPFCLEPWL